MKKGSKMVRRYFNPVEDIVEGRVGRALPGITYMGNYDRARLDARGDHMYALCDRGTFRQAVCVDDRETWEHFYKGQYMQGRLLTFDIYALTEAEHALAD